MVSKIDKSQLSSKRLRFGWTVLATAITILSCISQPALAVKTGNRQRSRKLSAKEEVETNDNDIANLDTRKPLFLFSGQSNMIGHSSDEQSINGNANLQDYLFNTWLPAIVAEKEKTGTVEYQPDHTTLADALGNAYETANIQNPSMASIANNHARMLGELIRIGAIDPTNIAKAHDDATCLFINPDHELPGVSTPVPIEPNSNCGASFGHELAFSHTISNPMNNNNDDILRKDITVAKVAVGGTTLRADWMPPDGTYWADLNATIHHKKNTANGDDNDNNEDPDTEDTFPGIWKGFVWHQGENDCFTLQHTGQDTTLTYMNDLKEFVEAVRVEIANANANMNPSDERQDPTTIPVAIMSLGKWPYGDTRDRLEKAQKDFTGSDQYAMFVDITDLGLFFHLDPIALLLSGYRLANQWLNTYLDEAVYTTSPYDITTDEPEAEETPSPTKQETAAPTTTQPTSSPTKEDTPSPTSSPTKHETASPTSSPTKLPTTESPTRSPIELPKIEDQDLTHQIDEKSSNNPFVDARTNDDDDDDDDDYDDDDDDDYDDDDDFDDDEPTELTEKQKIERDVDYVLLAAFLAGVIFACGSFGGIYLIKQCLSGGKAKSEQQYSKVLQNEDGFGATGDGFGGIQPLGPLGYGDSSTRSGSSNDSSLFHHTV